MQEGGIDGWVAQLKKPDIRKSVVAGDARSRREWESLLLAAGSPDRVLLIGFKTDKLKPLTGKTLAEVAKMRGVSPEDAAIDLVIEDHTRVGTAYFLMSEENVKLGLSQPWVNIGSDAEAPAPEGVFLLSNPHPRAYGNFARFLGRYVRDQKVTTLQDAIRRLTRLPAENFKLKDRGCLDEGCFADIVVFDPANDQRSCDVRQAAPVRDRRGRCFRERRAGAARWRAHRREARAGRARPGLGGLA